MAFKSIPVIAKDDYFEEIVLHPLLSVLDAQLLECIFEPRTINFYTTVYPWVIEPDVFKEVQKDIKLKRAIPCVLTLRGDAHQLRTIQQLKSDYPLIDDRDLQDTLAEGIFIAYTLYNYNRININSFEIYDLLERTIIGILFGSLYRFTGSHIYNEPLSIKALTIAHLLTFFAAFARATYINKPHIDLSNCTLSNLKKVVPKSLEKQIVDLYRKSLQIIQNSKDYDILDNLFAELEIYVPYSNFRQYATQLFPFASTYLLFEGIFAHPLVKLTILTAAYILDLREYVTSSKVARTALRDMDRQLRIISKMTIDNFYKVNVGRVCGR